MRDETLIEPFAAQEFYVDGFTDYSVANGLIFCAGYRLQPSRDGSEPLKVTVLRLIWPIAMLEEVIALARDAVPEDVPRCLRFGHH